MDEKAALGLNVLNLNARLKKQIAKRIDAPVPSDTALEKHFAVVAAPVAKTAITAQAAAVTDAGSDWFFQQWDKYYPTIVSYLGWMTALPKWMLPGGLSGGLLMIKSLLAIANNDLFPFVRVLIARPDLVRLVRLAVTSSAFLKKLMALLAEFERDNPPA